MARFLQKHGNYRPQLKIAGSGIFFSPKVSADALRDTEVAEASLRDNPCEIAANQLLQHSSERLGWPEIELLCLEVIYEGSPTVEHLTNKANGLRKHKHFEKAIAALGKGRQQFPGNQALEKLARDIEAEKVASTVWEPAGNFKDLLAPGQLGQGDETERLAEAIEKDPENVALVDKLIAVLEHRAEGRVVLDWINYRLKIQDAPHLRRKAFELERRLGTLTLDRETEELERLIKE